MKSLLSLVGLVVLSACGAAADGGTLFDSAADESAPAPSDVSAPSMADESPAAASDADPSPGARSDAAPAAVTPGSAEQELAAPAPAAAEPVWRTCATDDDCELRSSACLPLDSGSSVTYCRRPLARLGEPCGASFDATDPGNPNQAAPSDECEVGLVCAYAGIAHSAARVCAVQCYGDHASDYGCLRARLPLSCGAQGASTLDVHCEAE